MRILAGIAVFAYPILLSGNMAPWLRMGRISGSLDQWAKSSAEEEFTDRWVADLPVVTDGAYLFLSEAPPFMMLELDVALQARLHGVRTSEYKRLLREGAKRSRVGTLTDWDLMRVSSIDGRVERETIDSAFPIEMGEVEVRWARVSTGHVRVGEFVVGQLFLHRPAGRAPEFEARLELWLDGKRVAVQSANALIDGAGGVLTTPLEVPSAAVGRCEARLQLISKGQTRDVSLGPLRVEAH